MVWRSNDVQSRCGNCRVTHEQAEEKALTEYEKFRVVQDREIMSDFDRQLKMLFDGNEPNS